MLTKKYHSILISLHWILAIMIIASFMFGEFILSNITTLNPIKIPMLKAHIIFGLIILILTIFRLITRLSTKKPEAIKTGNKILDKLGGIVHFLFYVLILIIVFSGIASIDIASVFNGSVQTLISSGQILLDDSKPMMVHNFLTTILMFILLLHIGGFCYHQFFKKDSIFSRIWFK